MKKWISNVNYFFIIFIGMFWSIQADVPLGELKNSFLDFKQEFQHLSPLHGAVAWISGFTKNVYQFDNKSSLNKLSKSLFRLFENGEIVPSNAPDRAATYLTTEMIGTIIGTLEAEALGQQNIDNDIQNKQDISQHQAGKKNQKNVLKDPLVEKLEIALIHAAIESKNKFAKRHIIRTLNNFVANLRGALTECQSLESGYSKDTPIVLLLSFLYAKSSGKQDLEAYYQGLQKQLGIVKVFNNDTEIDDNNENIIAIVQNRTNQFYTQNELVEELERLRKQELRLEFLQGLRGGAYEKTVLALLSSIGIGGMPPVIQYCDKSRYETVSFSNCLENVVRNIINVLLYNDETEQFAFTKLEENCPSLADQQDNFDEKLKEFYATKFGSGDYQYSALSVKDANKQEVHDAWNQVVCNRDWCCYNRVVGHDGTTYKAPFGVRGFLKLSSNDYQNIDQLFPGCMQKAYLVKDITLEDVFQITLKKSGHTYLVFNPEKFAAYDLVPSIRNLIIVFDRLFGAKIISDIAAVFDSNDFNKKFWPSLCEVLNVSYVDVKESFKNIDTWDFTHQKIKFKLNLKADGTGRKKFSFFCKAEGVRYLAHADYKLVIEKAAVLSGLERGTLELLLQESSNNRLALSLVSVLLINTKLAELFVSLSDGMFNTSGAFYCAQHMQTNVSNVRLKVIKKILRLDNAPSHVIQDYLKNLIRITKPVTDLVPQLKILNALRKSKWVDREDNFYDDKGVLVILTLCAIDCLDYSDDMDEIVKLILTKAFGALNADDILLGNNPEHETPKITMLLAFAEKYVSFLDYPWNNQHRKIIKFIFEGLGAFEHGLHKDKLRVADDKKILERIITCAQVSLNAANDIFRESSFNLFKVLVNKGLAFDRVTKIAQDCIKSDEFFARENGLNLFKVLFKKHRAFKEAEQVAQELIHRENFNQVNTGLTLLAQLMNHGHAFQESMLAVQKHVKNYRVYIKNSVLLLSEKLIKHGYGFLQGLHSIQECLKYNNQQVKNLALKVLGLLVESLKNCIEKKDKLDEVTLVINEMKLSGHDKIKEEAQKLEVMIIYHR